MLSPKSEYQHHSIVIQSVSIALIKLHEDKKVLINKSQGRDEIVRANLHEDAIRFSHSTCTVEAIYKDTTGSTEQENYNTRNGTLFKRRAPAEFPEASRKVCQNMKLSLQLSWTVLKTSKQFQLH